MQKQDILNALIEAVKRAGTQSQLAQNANMAQGRISDYITGKYDIGNMTIDTLLKLFPEITISFFKDTEQDTVIPKMLEEQMLELFHSLDPNSQIKCFGLMCQKFGKD